MILLVLSIFLVGCTLAPQEQEVLKWNPKPVVGPQVEILQPESPEQGTSQDSELQQVIFKEGELVSFPNLAKADADGDPVTYTFTEPLDSQGKWQTAIGDAGEYKITITADDAKGASVSKDILLVIQAVNKAPVIDITGTITVKEGETVLLEPKITDPEGDEFTVAYSGWADAAEKQTSFADAGSYDETITATDSKGAKASKQVKIVIENVNRAPAIAALSDVTVKEGELVKIEAKASDEDNDKIIISYGQPLNVNGLWQTKVGDAGEHTATITASDGTDTATAKVKIMVTPLNRAPELQVPEEVTVTETETVTLGATATDPDGDQVTISYAGWMTSDSKETGYDDAGEYTVTVTATDSKGAEASKDVKITVNDKNRAPVIVI